MNITWGSSIGRYFEMHYLGFKYTTTGTPLQQRIDVLLNVHISVGNVFTNGFSMRCRWWRCKGLQQHMYMRW
jgi:hypothetical protein